MAFEFITNMILQGKIKSILKESKIGATTDLAIINAKRNSESLKIYDELKKEYIKSSNHFRGGVGERFITIIISEQNFDKVYALFEKHMVSSQKKIALIILDCPKSDEIHGIIAYITSIIYKKGINLHGFFTSQNEIMLILDEENAFEYVDYLKKQLKA